MCAGKYALGATTMTLLVSQVLIKLLQYKEAKSYEMIC
jgi:hypothetical protein